MTKLLVVLTAVSVALGVLAYLIGGLFEIEFLAGNAWLVTLGGLAGGLAAALVGRRKATEKN